MRERRWESRAPLTFDDVLALGDRWARRGLRQPEPSKELICYVEEWTVRSPAAIGRLQDDWYAEDITLIQVHDGWSGDFYLMAGTYHALYRQLKPHGAYCSVSHPWEIVGETTERLQTHHPQGMFWIGYRDTHAFIRVRLQTLEVVTPGEHRADDRRDLWLDERRRAFQSAISTLELPIDLSIEKERVIVRTRDEAAALLCSWPDEFGPCQFEFNVLDPHDLLARAGRLAATADRAPRQVRAYLTGFPETALEQFQIKMAPTRTAYRCSAHCRLDQLPELFRLIAPDGRLYATLCESDTSGLLPDVEKAWMILGVVGQRREFRIEARLNRAPLPEADMDGWLQELVGVPMDYAPLGAFP